MSQRKKVLFFIVEGISDSAAIANALEKIFSSEKVVVRVTQGDITSENSTTPQNISSKIVEEIKREMGRGYKPSDFTEVVQIVDTDGVFVSPEKVEYKQIDEVYYDEDRILCNNTDEIVKRNIKKALVLNRLIGLPMVWRSIPYSVYYMSANLDHVLHNDSNLPIEQKTNLADQFALQYKNDPAGFIQFFSSNQFTVQGEYQRTWDFIKLDAHSLHRHSNIHLLFSEKAKNGSILSSLYH